MLLVFVFLAGCTGGDGAGNEKLSEIEKFRGKKFPMTVKQKHEVDAYVGEEKKRLGDGDRTAADDAFAKALQILQTAYDADQFNKSE